MSSFRPRIPLSAVANPNQDARSPSPEGSPRTAASREKRIAKRVTVDRLLSKLGLASRSTGQEWIRAGRLRVNHRIVRLPGTWVSWPGDTIELDGQPVVAPDKRFLIFHKPKGVVTTSRDEKGRKTIFDGLPSEFRALHAVGRLDQATSGLLLLTNDSILSSFLTDPNQKVPRLYLVTLRGELTDERRQRAIHGLIDQGERLRCESLIIQKRSKRESHVEVTLTEGRNRGIRRLFKALGHEVTRLRRIQYGPFSLNNLESGGWRELPIEEARTALHHHQ